MVKGIAIVLLIFGLLKFAQEAPELFKKLFAAAGGLFEGIDLNPQHGLQDMRRVTNTVTGAVGGIAGGAVHGWLAGGRDYNDLGGTSRLGRIAHQLSSAAGGFLSGGARGLYHGFRADGRYTLTDGVGEGHAAGQAGSRAYRDGGTTNGLRNMLNQDINRIVRFGRHEWQNIQDFGHNLTELPMEVTPEMIAAQELFNRIKSNNTSSYTATGTDDTIKNLEKARDDAIALQRERFARGYIDQTALNDRIEDINNRFKAARRTTLENQFRIDASGHSELSDDRLDTIRQWNQETIRDLQRSAQNMSQQDIDTIVERMRGNLGLAGNATLNDVINTLNTRNASDLRANNGRDGANLMLSMSELQTALRNVNRDIQARQALQQHNNPPSNNSSGGNGGNNAAGGNS